MVEGDVEGDTLGAEEYAKKYNLELTPQLLKALKAFRGDIEKKLTVEARRAEEERIELARIQRAKSVRDGLLGRLSEVTESVKRECQEFEDVSVGVNRLTGLPVVQVRRLEEEEEIPILVMTVSVRYLEKKKRARSVGYGFAKRGRRWKGVVVGFNETCKKKRWMMSIADMVRIWKERVAIMQKNMRRDRALQTGIKKMRQFENDNLDRKKSVLELPFRQNDFVTPSRLKVLSPVNVQDTGVSQEISLPKSNLHDPTNVIGLSRLGRKKRRWSDLSSHIYRDEMNERFTARRPLKGTGRKQAEYKARSPSLSNGSPMSLRMDDLLDSDSDLDERKPQRKITFALPKTNKGNNDKKIEKKVAPKVTFDLPIRPTNTTGKPSLPLKGNRASPRWSSVSPPSSRKR